MKHREFGRAVTSLPSTDSYPSSTHVHLKFRVFSAAPALDHHLTVDSTMGTSPVLSSGPGHSLSSRSGSDPAGGQGAPEPFHIGFDQGAPQPEEESFT